MPYEYKAKVLRVVDGDTLEVDIDLGFGVVLEKRTVRLLGVDTPESKSSDSIEKQFGLKSKEFTQSFIDDCDGEVVIQTSLDKSVGETEKFGRILASVRNKSGTDLSLSLIATKNGVSYFGQSKAALKFEHAKNWGMSGSYRK